VHPLEFLIGEVFDPVSTLVQAECVRCPWLLAETKVATIFSELIFLFLLSFFFHRHSKPQKGLS
jgi:hypothetical protein